MVIGYKQQFPWGDPTWFKEKILLGQTEEHGKECTLLTPDGHIKVYPKIHTMREDIHNQWPPSTGIIHHAYGRRTKNYDCFLVNKYTGDQPITINRPHNSEPFILISGMFMSDSKIEQLAHNDGFSTVEDFFRWFENGFTGKIIHWTKFRY